MPVARVMVSVANVGTSWGARSESFWIQIGSRFFGQGARLGARFSHYGL